MNSPPYPYPHHTDPAPSPLSPRYPQSRTRIVLNNTGARQIRFRRSHEVVAPQQKPEKSDALVCLNMRQHRELLFVGDVLEARGDGVDLILVLWVTLTGSTKACQEHQGHDFSVSE
jgi:hypothetical protein